MALSHEGKRLILAIEPYHSNIEQNGSILLWRSMYNLRKFSEQYGGGMCTKIDFGSMVWRHV
ncbi:MAG: hypothetical protein WBV84_14235 [Nitrososphaeraceae archaeon]